MCENETTLSAIHKIVIYAIVTWGFNEQEQQCTVTLPVPQHKSRGGNCANEKSVLL